jgi:type III restriction enzyme
LPVAQPTDLSHVVEPAPFRDLGRRLAVDPQKFLARTQLAGTLTDQGRAVKVETREATTKVEAAAVLTTPAEGREEIIRTVVQSAAVGSRAGASSQVERLLGYALEGAGDKADLLLTRYADRVAGGLIRTISDQMRELVRVRTVVNEVVSAKAFEPRERFKRSTSSRDRYGKFRRGVGYEGWKKSLYEQVWFDSSPERDLANILDDSDEIELWVRLHRDDLPILWAGAERTYNPDLLARSTDGEYWIVETKDDRHMTDSDVREKRHAALAWANKVNGTGKYGTWHYLLVSETDLAAAKESWPALVAATRV